jgi:hypothetical protein
MIDKKCIGAIVCNQPEAGKSDMGKECPRMAINKKWALIFDQKGAGGSVRISVFKAG